MKQTSIKSVLYEVSLLLPEESFNEALFLEWATKAARKIGSETIFQDNVCNLVIDNHMALLPDDLQHINMVLLDMHSITPNQNLLEEIAEIANLTPDNGVVLSAASLSTLIYRFQVMKQSSTPFIKAAKCNPEIFPCNDCQYEYSYNAKNNSITSNLKSGNILVSYKAYITDCDGYMLIPDNEDFKEALVHYILYRYYLSRTYVHEDTAYRERDWHLARYSVLATKARGNENLPSLASLENMSQWVNKMVPRRHLFSTLFSNFGYKEHAI